VQRGQVRLSQPAPISKPQAKPVLVNHTAQGSQWITQALGGFVVGKGHGRT